MAYLSQLTPKQTLHRIAHQVIRTLATYRVLFDVCSLLGVHNKNSDFILLLQFCTNENIWHFHIFLQVPKPPVPFSIVFIEGTYIEGKL